MTLAALLQQIKQHPNYHNVGMILCHNGVVRNTSRDGRPVVGLTIKVDHARLEQVLQTHRSRPGIVAILAHIFENQHLTVGDDVMYLVVAGDIRDNVISTLTDTLNAIKSTVTSKTEYYAAS